MKTIGIIGGMSWESTLTYYQLINTMANEQLGGLHSAQLLISSIDFAELISAQERGDDGAQIQLLHTAASNLQTAGANYIVIATNTIHRFADEIMKDIEIPLLHIADAVGYELTQQGISTIGLLGTKITMEEDFYAEYLKVHYAIDTLIPAKQDREIVSNIIYSELCHGRIFESSRTQYLKIMAGLQTQGAEAIILGCTEIGLLVSQENTTIPIVDSTISHTKYITHIMLQEYV